MSITDVHGICINNNNYKKIIITKIEMGTYPRYVRYKLMIFFLNLRALLYCDFPVVVTNYIKVFFYCTLFDKKNLIYFIFNSQELNGSTITRELRRGAEYDYLKRYGAEWKLAQNDPTAQRAFNVEHCRFAELVSSK